MSRSRGSAAVLCGRTLASCLKDASAPDPKLERFNPAIEISYMNRSCPASSTRFLQFSSKASMWQEVNDRMAELKHGLRVDMGESQGGYLLQAEKAQLHAGKMKVDGSMLTAKLQKLSDPSVRISPGALGRQELKENLNRLLEISCVEVWTADVEEELGEFYTKLTPSLVKQAVKRMKPYVANGFLAWAGKQGWHTGPVYKSLFRSYLRADKPEWAKEVLKEMKEKAVGMNDRLFVELIQHYVKAGMLGEAEEAVNMMKSSGFSPDVMKIEGPLLNGYLEAASKEGQAGKHEGKEHREEYDYSALFRRFLKAGKPEWAKEVLKEMEEKAMRMDGKLFVELILQYVRAGMSAQAEEVVNMMNSAGLNPDVMNTLLGESLKAANKERQAGQQGDKEPREEHDYGALFDGFLKAGKLQQAKEVVVEMKETYVAMDFNILVRLIKRCWIDGSMAEAEEAVGMMKAFGCSDPKLHTVLLTGYLQVRDKEFAGRFLQGVLKSNDYEAAIMTYARSNNADAALQVLTLMENNGFVADVKTLYFLFDCLCRVEMIDEGLKLLAKMQEKNICPGVLVYNTLITKLWRKNRLEEALNLISRMKENGCQPDARTHGYMISIHLKSRQVEKAHLQLEEMKADGCMPRQDTFELFIVNACKVAEVDGALRAFYMAAEDNHKIHVGACNRLLKSLIKKGRIDEAFEVFEKMKDGVCQEDTNGSYAVMLRGSCGLSRFDIVHRLLCAAEGVELQQLPVCTFVEILQAYAQASKLKEAVALFREVERSGHNIFAAALDSLARAQRLNLGADFCKCLADDAAQVDELQLLAFLRLLVKAGRVGEARELMNTMLEKGLMDKEAFEDLFSLPSMKEK